MKILKTKEILSEQCLSKTIKKKKYSQIVIKQIGPRLKPHISYFKARTGIIPFD